VRAKILRMGPWSIAASAAGVASALSAVAAWGAMAPSSQLYGPTVRVTGDSGAIALTFDDGPNPAVTPRLLDLLEKHGARATFFMTGAHIRAFPQIAADAAERGHAIANHTETHPNLALLSSRKIADELSQCNEAIASATRRPPRWMRPPFGGRGPTLDSTARSMGVAGVVMWSKWAWDWKPQPGERVIQRLQRVRGGDIVLLHDGDYRVLEGDRHHTFVAMEYWLPRWKDAGLRFVTVDDWNSGT
jgi:peptidoglycan/xylan/chitin deacetylase (PgdA/CDA1 family)